MLQSELFERWRAEWMNREGNGRFKSDLFREDGPFNETLYARQAKRLVFVGKEPYDVPSRSLVVWWKSDIQQHPKHYRRKVSEPLRRWIEGALDDKSYDETDAHDLPDAQWAKRCIANFDRVAWINLKKQDDGKRTSLSSKINDYALKDAKLLTEQIIGLKPTHVIFCMSGGQNGAVESIESELLSRLGSMRRDWKAAAEEKPRMWKIDIEVPWSRSALCLIHAIHPAQRASSRGKMIFDNLMSALN